MGGELFVSSFRLAGLRGFIVSDEGEALRVIQELIGDPDVGLILVSDEFGFEFAERVEELSSTLTRPVIYLLPRPGGRVSELDYRAMLRRVLGI